MTHTNTTFSNNTAKNTAGIQLLTGDQRALRGTLLVTAISQLPIDSLKTTALPMLAQTRPQLPAAQNHDTGPHYRHWARLQLLIDDVVTA
jgi:hypothetical protein